MDSRSQGKEAGNAVTSEETGNKIVGGSSKPVRMTVGMKNRPESCAGPYRQHNQDSSTGKLRQMLQNRRKKTHRRAAEIPLRWIQELAEKVHASGAKLGSESEKTLTNGIVVRGETIRVWEKL